MSKQLFHTAIAVVPPYENPRRDMGQIQTTKKDAN